MPVATGFKNAVINKFPAETAVELLGIYTATINALAKLFTNVAEPIAICDWMM